MAQVSAEQFIRSLNPREMPRYSVQEAARYVGVPKSTMRAWFYGMVYGSKPNLRHFRRILVPASPDLLSFYDVASAHILLAFKKREINGDGIRDIVAQLQSTFPDARYPLLGVEFFKFGKNVVIKHAGEILNLSRGGQLGLKRIMEKAISRFELDTDMMPLRFTPLRVAARRGGGLIVMDPDYSFGRPIIRGAGVPAEVIARRNESGESVASLAKDYRVSRRAVKEAIEYFEVRRAA